MKPDPISRIKQDLMAGNHASAFKKARIEAKKQPNNPKLQNIAGLCLAEGGDHRAAAAYFQRAARLDPGNLDFSCNLVLALVLTDRADAAEKAIASGLERHPAHPRLWYLRAFNCLQRNDMTGAIEWAGKALADAPTMIEALNVRGIALADQIRTTESLADFERILELAPTNILALENCGERLNEMGRNDEARDRYREILQLSPGHGYALSRLAHLEDTSRLPHLLKAVDASLGRPRLTPDEKALLFMARGTAHDRVNQPDKAMICFDKAHEIDAQHRPYKPAAERRTFERLAELFRMQPTVAVPASRPAPIFVVGLPRSGTTLVELILSSAPNVASCGERTATERHFARLFADRGSLDEKTLGDFSVAYRSELPTFGRDVEMFVDKMPANYRFAGLLLAAFPNARIINVARDPRDVALSTWKQRFPAEAMNYASRMSWIADQANWYQRYIALWEPICGDRMLTIRYEDLVADPDAQTRRLANHCGIEWTPEMARPELNRAVIRTASLNQTRQAVHDRSVGGWQVHSDRLRAFTTALDPDLWSLDTA